MDARSHAAPSAFARQMNGKLSGMLRWEQLDALWLRVRAEPDGWYATQVGEAVPAAPLDANALHHFVGEVDALLRREHSASYCGIVYADLPEQPSFIKIYDPNHMGSFCGCSSTPIPPRWVLCRCQPERIDEPAPVPSGRRHWWNRLWAGGTA